MKTIVIAPPVSEPITLAEAKFQLRIDSTLEDDYVSSLISAARDRAESYCNRYFTEQQITVLYDEELGSEVAIPFPDVSSVDSLQYDDDGTIETVADTEYYVDLLRQRIIKTGTWPITDNYRVTMTTGAPASYDSAKQAMLMIITDLYELRTESVVGASVAYNPAVKALLYPYRVSLGL